VVVEALQDRRAMPQEAEMTARAGQSKSRKRSTRQATTATSKSGTDKTKKQILITLLQRSKGTTLAELGRAVGWQPHSVRGFLSGTAKHISGSNLQSEEAHGRARRYRLVKAGKGSR
jgi:hypothetical protein